MPRAQVVEDDDEVLVRDRALLVDLLRERGIGVVGEEPGAVVLERRRDRRVVGSGRVDRGRGSGVVVARQRPQCRRGARRRSEARAKTVVGLADGAGPRDGLGGKVGIVVAAERRAGSFAQADSTSPEAIAPT